MTDILDRVTEEEPVLEYNEEEDDEETRDFYIYILSREHPTVLTPVANPYKRSDRIKEANAELKAESPPLGTNRTGARIRFNDTPMLYEYIKQEDVLSLLNEDLTSYDNDISPINQNSKNDMKNYDVSNEQTVTKRKQLNNDWTAEIDTKNENNEDQSTNKENIKPLEDIDTKYEQLSKENNRENIKTTRELDDGILENHALLLTADADINETRCGTKNQDTSEVRTDCFTLDESSLEETNKKKVDEYNAQEVTINKRRGKTIKYDTKTDDIHGSNEFEAINNNEEINNITNDLDQSNRSEVNLANEKRLPINGVEINPIVNNIENKLNYRPSSTERVAMGVNNPSKISPSNNGKLKTSTTDKEIKTDVTKNSTKINGSTKKNISVVKGKVGMSETIKKTKPPVIKANKADNVKAPSKETVPKLKEFEGKNSARVKPTRRSSIEEKEIYDYPKENIANDHAKSPPLEDSKINKSPELKPSNEHSTQLTKLPSSGEEMKSKLQEIKEQNRSKLVVLVPPFEQYKSYMNDNYSDSDDNESFDLEEFLRKENQNDLQPYLPDFELESDNELDELCKENANLAELSHLYPESICTNINRGKLKGSLRKKGSSGSSKRMTRSLEDDELRTHQCKMMNNVKNSQQYENSVKKFSQDNGGGGGGGVGKCKQKCLQRPSTAPGGRKFGCDCKWPRVKLPEYNGLRSEYGLSAEQLCERKRQRQEITKRIRERRQRKVDEEERRKMENERMFHEWLLKKRAQAKEQWLRNQRLRAMRYSRQCITPNQTKPKLTPNKSNTPLAIRKKLHPGRNCFSLDEIIHDVTERNDDNKTYKIYLGLSIE